ncbi:Hydrogenase maturation factor HoxT/HybE [Marinobacterium lacunae]|uniref:Hydrogenase maturation factor HoxT/HybE n=1 Tax=Marinobacterium lacunae TaxID=1232683 RepID=A0A081G4G8_9GAMM|nr:[NiFe]-hydrogenase assembly chaperone HybE [Marinobacterium lacunae]KEA65673.1 Hydrogenase maturation factor HoxT/HybE [Marinobacterium lacunae]
MSALSQLLQQYYSEADERMSDLPFYNALLSVEMAAWHCLDADLEAGVLITPWCLNLLWRPADPDSLPEKGSECVLTLASGEYSGVVAEAEGLGRFASASLLSDTSSLASQEQARLLAHEIADLLFLPSLSAASEEVPENPARRAMFRRMMGAGQ